uniref:Putative LOC101859799 [Aplysia californica] n=1 Tax=Lepeophtheirus salmonis TaxID=72036 RepID=A0A0K2UTJ2_LEPSM
MVNQIAKFVPNITELTTPLGALGIYVSVI